MAPEPAILKRKRSRPSDYWIVGANANATPQQYEGNTPAQEKAAKKGGEGRSLSDKTASAVGNRGSYGKKTVGQDEENMDPDASEGKAVRRGRSSGTGAESRVGDAAGLRDLKGAERWKSRATTNKTNVDPGINAKGSKKAGHSSIADEADQLAPAEGSAPALAQRNRGRPSFSKPDATVVAQETAGKSPQAPRRGRSSNTAAGIRDVAEAAAQTNAQDVPRKQGRPASARAEGAELAAEGQEGATESVPIALQGKVDSEMATGGPSRRRKSVRISDAGSEVFKPSKPSEADLGMDKKRKTRAESARTSARDEGERGRQRTRSDDSSQELAQVTTKTGKKAADQRPYIEVEVETASSKLTKGKQKPGVVSRKPSKAATTKSSSAPQASSKARSSRKASGADPTVSKKASSRPDIQKASSATQAQVRKRREVESDIVEEPSKRRRISNTAQRDDIPEIAEHTSFPHLEPTTHRVSRLKIETKWELLSPGCIDQISTLLSDLQKPVIARLKEDKKKSHVSIVLKSVSRKLLKKLSKGLPFPPATSRTREDDLDFEKILDQNRVLESRLTPALHANELLEAELRKEMARLESDRQNLADLEANAKRETVLRNEGTRALHSLLQPDCPHEAGNFQLDVGWGDKKVYPSLDASINDEKLQDLIKNLSGHMDSIQGNIKQVDGIAEGLAKTRGVVQARLFDHLDRTQYEAAILGSDT